MLRLLLAGALIAATLSPAASAGEMADGSLVMTHAIGVGDVSFMSVMTVPGAGEVHPVIRLKDGTTCDLLNLVCLSKGERDFGPEVYAKLHRAVRQIAGQSL